MEPENEIDQLFKRGLNDPEIPFNELDWSKMERKLDEKKKRRILPFWLYTATGIAAALLIFLFWFLSGPSVFEKRIKTPLAARKVKSGTINQLPAAGTDTIKAERLAGTAAAAAPLKNEELGISNVSSIPHQVPAPALVNSNTVVVSYTPVPFKPPVVVKSPEALNTPLTDSAILAQKAMALALSKDPLEKINHNEIAKSVQKKMDGAFAQRPGLILSALAGPDITSGPSNTSKSAKVSSNLGVLATYALGSKFSLTSGAVYAKKYYNYGAGSDGSSSYAPSAGSSDWEVKADCNVLDIPVNVNYKVLDKKKFSMSVNTGLSSYFMLKEKYDYVVDKPGEAQQVTTTEFSNQNQHILGVANISVSFDHRISNNLSVGVQPFAKLPLTGIGNYDVSLKSTGVAFSLNIGLFPSKKPGKLAANHYSSLH